MSDSDLLNVFLGRQPILDRQQQLFAYELLFRSSSEENANCAKFVDGNQATATVISNAFTEFSMADALGPYQCFIKVDHGLLFSDLIYALPPHCVVLEILETTAPTPETLDIMIDEEAMGDLAERIATPTPAPEMTPEPIYDDPEVDAPFPDDL